MTLKAKICRVPLQTIAHKIVCDHQKLLTAHKGQLVSKADAIVDMIRNYKADQARKRKGGKK